MGRPPRNSIEDVCRIIALHPEPVITSSDIYEKLGMTQRGAQNRLETLVEEGYLESKDVGARAKVYWLTDRGRNTLG